MHVSLDPGESIFAERGALVYMDSGIQQSVVMNGKGLWGVLGSKLSGESIFLTKYTNTSSAAQNAAFSGASAGIRSLQLQPGQVLILRRGDYVASQNRMDMALHLSFNKMIKGTEPAFQRVKGQGTVFFSTPDELLEKELAPGEEIIVDEERIKALLDISDDQIRFQRKTNVLRNVLSGEGLLLTRIVGPGKVYLSSVRAIRKRL